MDAKILIYAIIAVFGAIIGVYIFVFRHIGTRKKHACSDDLVFKDVCDERSKNLNDCIESEVKTRGERYAELKKDINDRFDRLEKLIQDKGG